VVGIDNSLALIVKSRELSLEAIAIIKDVGPKTISGFIRMRALYLEIKPLVQKAPAELTPELKDLDVDEGLQITDELYKSFVTIVSALRGK